MVSWAEREGEVAAEKWREATVKKECMRKMMSSGFVLGLFIYPVDAIRSSIR